MHHVTPKVFSPSFCWHGQKMDFSGGERRRASRMRGSVTLPRSIDESKPPLVFHSSLSFLFYLFTFFCLYQVFSPSHAARKKKPKNADKQLSGRNPASLFALDPSQEKIHNLQQLCTSPPPTLTKLHFISDWTFAVVDPELRNSIWGFGCHRCPYFT